MTQAKDQVLQDEETPQSKHTRRWAKRDQERRANVKQVDVWLEHTPDRLHEKGGKVVKAVRTSTGNVQRTYLGRYKQVKDIIEKYQSEGIKVRT